MLRLIAVGRLRDGRRPTLFARYKARLRPKLAVTEIAGGARRPGGDQASRRPRHCWGRCRTPAFVVALDSGGDAPDSARICASCWNAGWRRAGRSASLSAAPRGWTRR